MWVEQLRAAQVHVFPTPGEQQESRVAIVLNANARGVTPHVERRLGHGVAEEDLFVSRSLLEARRIAQLVLARRYDVVFCGGGDGTFSTFVNEVLMQRRPSQRLPRFGVLRLGTGNSVATLLSAGARPDELIEDVLRARAGEVPALRKLDLLLVDGRRAPFAGLGVDGQILNDYVWVKERLAHGPLRSVLSGKGGYAAAVTLRTLPHYLTNSTWVECEAINGQEGPAYRLDTFGRPIGEAIPPGGTLFTGPVMMAAAATVPFYGFELKMFPFATRRRGMMHLRLGALRPGKVLANLGRLWRGEWFPSGVCDFHAREVVLRFARPMPFQIAGDAEGYREEVTLKVHPDAVEVLDFAELRN